MSEPVQDNQVDPIAFTRERMVEIGEMWKSYALSKKSEALSKVESSIDKAPPQLKKLFGLSKSSPEVGNGADTQPDA